jgi:hypothetical protein
MAGHGRAIRQDAGMVATALPLIFAFAINTQNEQD